MLSSLQAKKKTIKGKSRLKKEAKENTLIPLKIAFAKTSALPFIYKHHT